MGKQSVWSFIKAVHHSLVVHDCFGLAAEMAFHLMLSFIPLLIFVVSMFGMFGYDTQTIGEIVATLEEFAPPYAVVLLQQVLLKILSGSSQKLAIASMIFVLLAASNGAAIIFKGLNRMYDIQTDAQHFLYRRFWGAVIVAALTVFMFVGSNLLIFGHVIQETLSQWFHVSAQVVHWINWLRWVLPLVGMMLFIAGLYALITSLKKGVSLRLHNTVPGVFIFVLLWIVLSLLFGMYVENLGRFNQVYGTLGAIMVLMLWFYFSSLALLVGAAVNAVLALNKKVP